MIIVVMIWVGYYTARILWIQHSIRIVQVLSRICVLVDHRSALGALEVQGFNMQVGLGALWV